MATHGITEYPKPCGNTSCCQDDKKFYCQMLFCSTCTLCLIYREAKANYPQVNPNIPPTPSVN